MKFETAVLTWLGKIMRKDTNSAYHPDRHSNEAIREAVESRLAAASYTAPDNGSIAAIKARTDTLPASVASSGDIALAESNIRGADGDTLQTISEQIDALDTGGNGDVLSINGIPVTGPDDLKADVSGLATTAALSAHDSKLDSVKAKTDQLGFSGEAVQARVADRGVLNDLSGVDAQTACAAAIATYDPPTKAEMDSGFAGLNNLSLAQAQTAAGNALAIYDPPTKTEQDAAFTEIKGSGWTNQTLVAIKAAIDTIGTPGGNSGYDPTTRAFTLNENINAGELVRVVNNSGGKIAKVPAGLAKSAERQISQSNDLSACQISDTKILLIYPGYGTNYGTAQLIEVQGKTVTVGTPHVFKSISCGYIRAAYDAERNCLALFYNGNSSGCVMPGSIHGLGMSFVPSSEMTGIGYYPFIATFVPSQSSFVLLYNAGSTQMNAVACQIDTSTWTVTKGSDISCGWVSSVTPDFASGCYCTQSDRLYYVFIYNSYYLYDAVVSVAGVTVTVQRSIQSLYNTYPTQPQCVYAYEDPVTKYVLLAYSGYWNYAYNCLVMILNVTTGGSSFQNYGSIGYAGVNAFPYSIRIVRDTKSGGSCVLTLKGDNGYGYYRDFTVAANGTITWGAPVAVYKSASLSMQTCLPLIAPYGVAIFCRASGDSTISFVTIYPSAMDAIGFLQESGTAGQSKNVKLIIFPGGVSEGHSGLTPGKRYYISSAAMLVATEGFYVGYAIDTTKLLITRNDFNMGEPYL